MGNLGRIQKCEELIAFRVDHRIIPPGTRLRRYYVHEYAQLVGQMQSFIETGSASLAQHLTVSEWQQFDLSDKPVGLESDVTKMR